MKVVVLGATKGMGRALSRQLATRGDQLVLLGRDELDLARSAADLRIRAASTTVSSVLCDLESPDGFGAAIKKADEVLDGFDTFVITAAVFAQQDALEADTELTQRLVTVNFANTVVLCEHVRKYFLQRGGGRLVVFSSVAGDRARKPVVIYGAAKAGLSAYLEGLDHKYRGRGLITLCVKPGFVKTGMTDGLKPPPFAGEAEAVAARVIRAIDRGLPVVYAPAIWRWVMLMIRVLPRFVMRRIGF